MVTITIILWLIILIIPIILYGLDAGNINSFKLGDYYIFLLIFVFISVLIGVGINFDLYHTLFSKYSFLITALVVIGLSGLLTLLVNIIVKWHDGVGLFDDFDFKKVLLFLLQVIGFVGSVLGIYSFYLEYIKN